MSARRIALSFAAVSAALALSACATAKPAPLDPVVELGMGELKERHFESARALFHSAGVERPSATAAFYEGAALNRLGRFQQAFECLDRASAMGLRHPELDFEAGWSLLGLRRWEAAIVRLERYESRRPGRGKTSELLGRAYLGAWKPEKAEAKLREAMQRDPALRPGAIFYLAVLERSRNEGKATEVYVRAFLTSAPESRLALVVPQTAAPRRVATLATDVVAAPAMTQASGLPERYVRARFANVRRGPGVKAKVLTVVKVGVRLVVVGEQPGWYNVRLEDGREGWIAASVTAPQTRQASRR